jgi:hypothetical protein
VALGGRVSVFAELKRRNVFRVAALYVVAAWVLLQVGDLLFDLLGLPAWTNKLLFAGLVLGFVPALIFSWVYELTPEGLKREHEVERHASITAETARKLNLIVVGLLVIAIGVVAVERFMPRTPPVPAATDAASDASPANADASSAQAPVEAAGRKALELDPGAAHLHYGLGRTLILRGQTNAALQEMQQETENLWRLSGLPLVFHALGRSGESDAALAALKDKYAGEMAYQIAEVHAFRGEGDLAFEWLERAYAQRDGGLADTKSSRFLRMLADDPRYKAFLRKLKLPE